MPAPLLLILALLLGAVHLHGQTPLQPTWVHTWPFGQQDAAMWYQPISGDNHVAVDPVTGLVYCTISDVNALTDWQNELLYTFDGQGNDLTPSAVPVLTSSTYTLPPGPPTFNPHSTSDIAVWNGTLVAAHQLRGALGNNWSEFFSFGEAGGIRHHVIPGIASPAVWTTARVAMDGTHALLLNHLNGLIDRHLFCMTNEGWPQWMVDPEAQVIFHDVAIHDDVAYACTGPSIIRRSMADGTLLPSFTTNGHAQRIALGAERIHYAGSPTTEPGTVHIACSALDGTPQWSTPVTIGDDLWLTGIVVDQAGHTWVSATLIDPIDQLEQGGRLLHLDTEGDLLHIFSYGATMNGIATDGTQLYITGWSSTSGSETYLLAMSTDVTTSIHASLDAAPLILWPQPTDGLLNVVLPTPAQGMDLLDATGRLVRQWSTGGATPMRLDLGTLPTGTYVLRVINVDGTSVHEKVVVQR